MVALEVGRQGRVRAPAQEIIAIGDHGRAQQPQPNHAQPQRRRPAHRRGARRLLGLGRAAVIAIPTLPRGVRSAPRFAARATPAPWSAIVNSGAVVEHDGRVLASQLQELAVMLARRVEIGVVMLVYLNQAIRRRIADARSAGRSLEFSDVQQAVIEGALLRVRPIMMTVSTIIVGLLPIMLGSGTGSEVMRRIAAPMVGGMVSATILTLIVLPAVYLLWKKYSINRNAITV